jgi:hypothetical protein
LHFWAALDTDFAINNLSTVTADYGLWGEWTVRQLQMHTMIAIFWIY